MLQNNNSLQGKKTSKPGREKIKAYRSTILELMKAALHSPNYGDYKTDFMNACELLELLDENHLGETLQLMADERGEK